MVPLRPLVILAFMAVSAMAQSVVEDPVMQAKTRRATQVGEGDLPPVPRTVLEPPPLPPPEAYERKGKAPVKPAKGGKVSKASAKAAAKESHKKGGKKAAKAEGKGHKAPARKAVKHSKKRK